MKKFLICITLCSLFLLSACNKDEISHEAQDSQIKTKTEEKIENAGLPTSISEDSITGETFIEVIEKYGFDYDADGETAHGTQYEGDEYECGVQDWYSCGKYSGYWMGVEFLRCYDEKSAEMIIRDVISSAEVLDDTSNGEILRYLLQVSEDEYGFIAQKNCNVIAIEIKKDNSEAYDNANNILDSLGF